ncbi:hypothetical protein RBB75_14355 [Tunturibacter empetritectus]|uniref:Conjugative transfer protein TrbI n=1 Tax=Tunturiibacter empetritectus TaxID=3069691 RepID=A0AAU7Z9H2_9BACT
MDLRKLPLCSLAFFASVCAAQSITVPAGTPFPVQIEDHLPMRVGQAISAELIYPIYIDNTEVLPAGTVVSGMVVGLHANHSQRVSARLRGDFTPFRTPVVRFTGVTLADGTTVPLVTGVATDGAPIYRLVAPPPRQGGFVHQQWDNGKQILKDKLAIVTGPDKGDRLKQFLYTQLPCHPQRIEKKTAWTVETSEPLSLSQTAVETVAKAQPVAATPAPAETDSRTWIIQAYLGGGLSSATSKSGEAIEATVAEPIYNPDHTIAVPEGATIVGAVTEAKPARSFGRGGTLHFDFRQLILPSGVTQNVQASLTGADSAAPDKLALDSEGQVKPKPQDKLLVPFTLLVLAARPLDVDKGEGAGGGFGKNAVASNSLGAIGFIVGTALQQRNVAAGLGYYGAAISIYERWIKRGRDVTFARDTRLVLQTTPRNSTMLPSPKL